MIIVRLRGGLGNQLFQYAAGRSLAEHHGVKLKLDLYTYRRHRYRKFELHPFAIDAPEASREEVHCYTGSNAVVRYINKRENYFRCPKVFSQPHYHYYEDFFSLPDDLYLSGYWQSEKFFSPSESLIRSQIVVRQPMDETNAAWQRRMRSENSVSIHVRRGDYASQTDYTSFFGVLPVDYYRQAIDRIRQSVGNPVFYFFSDDVEWSKETFSAVKGEFINHNRGDESFKDMLLMSSCRHHIIANSTFSWWGAWLNPSLEKVVIAPQQWFRLSYLSRKEPVYPSRFYNTRDLIPPSWIRL